MVFIASTHTRETSSQKEDERLFGWDATPGIVSVWASRNGQALVWRREGERITCTSERFRPWLFATSLADLAHIGTALQPSSSPGASQAKVTCRLLDGPPNSFRYLLSSSDGRFLERILMVGASRRLERQVTNLNDLQDDYYRVGPIDQYLMLTGQVYFRGLNYD